jgi:hypothetical protein
MRGETEPRINTETDNGNELPDHQLVKVKINDTVVMKLLCVLLPIEDIEAPRPAGNHTLHSIKTSFQAPLTR